MTLWQVCKIGYVAWHIEAERRYKKGERQIQCANCGKWIFPQWGEDVAEHDAQSGHKYEKASVSIRRRT